MRRFLTLLRDAVLISILLIAVAFGYLYVKGSALDRESKAFVDRVIPALADGWDKQRLLPYVSPAFLRENKDSEINARLKQYRSDLVKFLRYDGATGQAKMVWVRGGWVITAEYKVIVTYDDGPAQIRILLVHTGTDWKIKLFEVMRRQFND